MDRFLIKSNASQGKKALRSLSLSAAEFRSIAANLEQAEKKEQELKHQKRVVKV